MTARAAYQDWIDRARAERTETVLRERGILKTLKGRNGSLAGPCPNCGGRDRFGVDLLRGLFNCRGCGTGGGDAIALVQFLDGCDFLDAVETLAGEYSTLSAPGIPAAKPEAEVAQDNDHARRQHEKAAWLWSERQPIKGTIAERYLREARGITCPLPSTLGFLPSRKPEHHPAMIAAFALTDEIEPGLLGAPSGIEAVHLTLLKPDGSGKADTEPSKLVVGSPCNLPIVIAPPNDLLGLATTEGIEDALTAHQATGLGAWAAGSAGRMPGLAEIVPRYVEAVTIYSHADKAGRTGACGLAAALNRRVIEVFMEGLP
jgi:hypothetical protein